MSKIAKLLRDFWNQLTLEPMVLIFSFAWGLESGAKLDTNLLMWKVCHIELGFNETICQNLTADEQDEIQTTVQRRVNDFGMVYDSGQVSVRQ